MFFFCLCLAKTMLSTFARPIFTIITIFLLMPNMLSYKNMQKENRKERDGAPKHEDIRVVSLYYTRKPKTVAMSTSLQPLIYIEIRLNGCKRIFYYTL